MPGAVWRRDVGAWVLDNMVVQLEQPPLRRLIPLVLDESPVRLVLATARDAHAVAVLLDAIMDRADPVDADLLDQVADAIVEAWFGMARWTVQRIWREALGLWREIDGDLTRRGVDVLALPPDRATNVMFAVLRSARVHDPTVLERWLHELGTPPERTLDTDSGQQAAAADWAAFAALAGMPDTVTGVDSELITT